MTDARWIEVEDNIDAACRHFGNAAKLYDEGGFDAEGLTGYRARMALLHSMQSGHTSLEGVLKRILEVLGEEAPAGDQSTPTSLNVLLAPYRRPAMYDRQSSRKRSHATSTKPAAFATALLTIMTTLTRHLRRLR